MRLRASQHRAARVATSAEASTLCPPHTRDPRYKERSRSMRSNLLVSAAALVAFGSYLPAQYARPVLTRGVNLEQKLNSPVPLDLMFHDETGQLVPLRTFFGEKPVVLS